MAEEDVNQTFSGKKKEGQIRITRKDKIEGEIEIEEKVSVKKDRSKPGSDSKPSSDDSGEKKPDQPAEQDQERPRQEPQQDEPEEEQEQQEPEEQEEEDGEEDEQPESEEEEPEEEEEQEEPEESEREPEEEEEDSEEDEGEGQGEEEEPEDASSEGGEESGQGEEPAPSPEGGAAEGAGAEEAAAAESATAAAAKRAAATAAAEGAAVAAEGAVAATGAFVAALPWIAAALLVIFLIVAIFGVTTLSVVAVCKSDWISVGGAVYLGLQGATLGQFGEVCKKLEGLGPVVTSITGFQPSESQLCPAKIKPDENKYPKLIVDCEDCINMENLGIEVKPRPATNPLANRGLANALARVAAKNSTFRVTEGFCPTVNHSSPNHYNGYAVDVDLKPEYDSLPRDEKISLLAKLSQDLLSEGFIKVLCEYPKDYSTGELKCGEATTTIGGHIHAEYPGGIDWP